MADSMTRRDFVRTGSAAAASALAGCASQPLAIPQMAYVSAQDTIKIGLVGCGGRGTGAAENCLASAPNVQMVAMADMFKDRLDASARQLAGTPGFKVAPGNMYVGLDAHEKLIKEAGVDLVLLATPPGFRPLHFAAAVAAGKHCFIEKPVAVDPAGVRKVIETGEEAKRKKLAVVAGTQYRHQKSFMETIKRVHDGWIGEIVAGRAYYNTGTLWHKPRKANESEIEWQIRNWLYFDWLSGDHFVEQHIHTIDVTDWVMNGRPVKAVGVGGRQVRTGEQFGNIYDHFSIDYEYAGGKHVTSMARQFANCPGHVGAYFTGTKGEVDVYNGVITGAKSWSFQEEFSEKPNIGKAYVQEHTDLIASIREAKPANEARRVAESTLTAIMGREAAYTGKILTWEEMTGDPLDLSPPQPLKLGDNPVRPVPLPGKPRE
jgi:predicted dehydrogenase